MKNNIILFLTLVSISTAYSQQYVIKAELTGFKDQTKFFLTDLDNKTVIDSALIVSNKFTMKGKLSSTPDFLRLYTIYENQFYYAFMFIGNDAVTLKADRTGLPFDYKITGSESQDLESILYDDTKGFAKQHDALVTKYHNLTGDSAEIKGKQIYAAITKLSEQSAAVSARFIKDHLNSYAGVAELSLAASGYNKDTLQRLYNALQPLYQQSKYGKRIATYLNVGDQTKAGDTYADFTAIDPNNVAHKLSDIQGKYILLDFSINGCVPCTESVKDMKKLAAIYPDKLTVITFSADASKISWLNTIARDNPTWLTLWDGKGNESETLKKYGVTGYPTFFVIDPKGKIIWTDSGYGEGSLEKKVRELVGE